MFRWRGLSRLRCRGEWFASGTRWSLEGEALQAPGGGSWVAGIFKPAGTESIPLVKAFVFLVGSSARGGELPPATALFAAVPCSGRTSSVTLKLPRPLSSAPHPCHDTSSLR